MEVTRQAAETLRTRCHEDAVPWWGTGAACWGSRSCRPCPGLALSPPGVSRRLRGKRLRLLPAPVVQRAELETGQCRHAWPYERHGDPQPFSRRRQRQS
ncbi:MAG: hypothetical protein NZL87_09875, partial [Thermomicrobium sp.]|nr:hypothetical protein [Thermomicrobium sp.]